MIAEESQNQRKLIGSLDAGKDVIDELTRVCELQRVKSGELSFAGRVKDVRLARFVDGEYKPVPIEPGVCEIVHVNGNVAMMGDQTVLRIDTLLSASGPIGQQMVFGQLRSAEIVECEFVLTAHEDLVSSRKLDPETGQLKLSKIERSEPLVAPTRERKPVERIAEPRLTNDDPEEEPKEEPKKDVKAGEESSNLSWEDAAKAAEDVKPARKRAPKKKSAKTDKPNYDEFLSDVDEDDLALLSPGDILDHPKLGECRVIKIEDEEYAHIRLQRGQIRKLALEVCEINFDREEDGRNVFTVRIKS